MILQDLRPQPGEIPCSARMNHLPCIRATHGEKGHVYVASEYGRLDEDGRDE